jgi:large subunit ribosomal protein L4
MATRTTTKKKTLAKDASLEAPIYGASGKNEGTVALPGRIFGLPWNADLVHQVLLAERSNQRANTAQVKGRGEVRGGGKKPWKQKGTGRARHGSSRSPIWRGGGITHGPTTDRNYDKKVNKKMRAKALYTLLSQKYKDGELLFVSPIEMKEIKTKTAASVVKTLAAIKGYEGLNRSKHTTALLTTPELNATITKSFRNLENVSVDTIKNLSPLTIASFRFLVITAPEESIAFLAKKIGA